MTARQQAGASYDAPMPPATASRDAATRWGRALWRWVVGWWDVIHLGAQLMVLALSPASYGRAHRPTLSRHLWLGCAPLLPGFLVLSSLIGVVLIRIVIVTARSYGLSQYALEMVVRVLVLELIPLIAALYVALRYTLPSSEELIEQRLRGALDVRALRRMDPMRERLLPRVLAGMFSVAMLALLAGVIALVLAYVLAYGWTVWGLPAYTRLVGHVFHPVVVLIFVLKTVFFSLAVSVIPIASCLQAHTGASSRTSLELQGLVRMLAVLLAIEVVSLLGNYL